MPRRFVRGLLATLLLTVSLPVAAQPGALTISRNLQHLTERAATIVRGQVLSARVERHPQLGGLHTVVVTLRVRETLKGAAGATYTFRQYIWDLRDRHDAAGYRKGDDLLLMMIEPSAYGLSSPAGMDQGRFRIRREHDGREMAVDGRGNWRLFDGLAAKLAEQGRALSSESAGLVTVHRSGPVDAAALRRLILELEREDR